MVEVVGETLHGESHRQLSTREQQVVDLVVQGYSNKEVGHSLGIAVGTVAVHLNAAMRKLGCKDRGTLIRIFSSRRAGQGALTSLALGDEVGEVELSRAEREVTRLLYAGRSTAQIAAARGVSYPTIAKQLDRIYRKAGVSSRWQLLARFGSPGSIV